MLLKAKLLASSLLILICLVSIGYAQTPAIGKGYYISVQPTANGPTALIGPWNWYAAAADVDGSILYSHPWACHINPNVFNCRILGNGIAYPKNTPYPPPHQIPSSGPILLPTASNPHMYGWYGLFYYKTGIPVVYPKAQWVKYHALVRQGLGIFPQYRDSACPGWPFFFVGSGINQNDFACN